MSWRQWAPYVPVAKRRANAMREIERLKKKGKNVQPIRIEGRTIARSFWGKGWCDHLESFSDFQNRLPRGRTYVRNGSVCHLDIQPGRIESIVSGSRLYNIRINIKKLKPLTWKSVKKNCSGRIGSMLELLQGRLSDQVMAVVTDRKEGLFPQPREIELKCDCPDWAVMCKHVAATLYAVGSMLDNRPELLFLLRDVDADELISTEMAVPIGAATADMIDDDRLGDIFGIDLDNADERQPPRTFNTQRRGRANKRPALTMLAKEALRGTVRKPVPSNGESGASQETHRQLSVRTELPRSDNRSREPHGSPEVAVPRSRPTGRSVARLRARLGLSAAEFARRLGVTSASVYRWEATTGRLKLQSRPLAALAKLQQQTDRT